MKTLQKLEKKNVSENDIKKNIEQYIQDSFDKIVKKYEDENVIFVGLNFPDPHVEYKGKFISVKPFKINIDTKHKFFIDIDDKTLLTQLFRRELKYLLEDEKYFNDIFNDALKKKKFVFQLSNEDHKFWKSMYKNESYKYYDKEKIKKTVSKLLA